MGFAPWALKESVDGWPIGYHYPQDIRGSTEVDTRGDPASCLAARRGDPCDRWLVSLL